MAITAGTDILASDFISTAAPGAGDSGKVAKLDANGKIPLAFLKFGGTGADGALSISSGTTTLSFGSATLLIKNYTSVSITGTAQLAFSNPTTNGAIFLMKSQGNVTVTSSTVPAIDLRLMGGAGSAGSAGNGGVDGGAASDGLGLGCPYPTAGSRGALAVASTVAPGDLPGAVAGAISGGRGARLSSGLAQSGAVFCAAGGSAGSASNGCGAFGGRGGGGMRIECGGNLNITSTIDASGSNGDNSTGSTGSGVTASGGRGGGGNVDSASNSYAGLPANVIPSGGGGGGGCIIILYNGTLTANTGTYTVTGGSPGTTGSGIAATSGAVGYSFVGLNTQLT